MRRTRITAGGDAVDALVTDDYLETLLAGADAPRLADVEDLPAAVADPALRHASDVVRASLLRVHPSFRFEERLADRLAELAATSAARAVAAGGSRPGELIRFPTARDPERAAHDPLLEAVLDGSLDPTDEAAVARAAGVWTGSRPLILGGAITSAAISLVGVAWVAWRASRSNVAPTGRAARAAHARRLADLAELAAGLPGGPA